MVLFISERPAPACYPIGSPVAPPVSAVATGVNRRPCRCPNFPRNFLRPAFSLVHDFCLFTKHGPNQPQHRCTGRNPHLVRTNTYSVEFGPRRADGNSANRQSGPAAKRHAHKHRASPGTDSGRPIDNHQQHHLSIAPSTCSVSRHWKTAGSLVTHLALAGGKFVRTRSKPRFCVINFGSFLDGFGSSRQAHSLVMSTLNENISSHILRWKRSLMASLAISLLV